jgi:hypothetical protein
MYYCLFILFIIFSLLIITDLQHFHGDNNPTTPKTFKVAFILLYCIYMGILIILFIVPKHKKKITLFLGYWVLVAIILGLRSILYLISF